MFAPSKQARLKWASLVRPPCLPPFASIVDSLIRCPVTYHWGPFQGHGTIWNLSCTGWRPSGDLPMRPGKTLSLTVMLPNEQHILSREQSFSGREGEECAVENGSNEEHTRARLQHYL